MSPNVTAKQLPEIKSRLLSYFDKGRRLVFWEDLDGSYSEIIKELNLENVRVINATGCELASKRVILRHEPQEPFLIYRQGVPPIPADDFLYDLKLAALPFSVSAESMWAEECGIPAHLAKSLNTYARFFASTKRRQQLKNTVLPKNTPSALARAVLGSCVSTTASNWLDALRDLVKAVLTEWAEESSTTYRLICDCGLAPQFWTEVTSALGYAPQDGNPTVDDLAFEVLASSCKELLPSGRASLTADAQRILFEMAANPQKRAAYEQLIEKCAAPLADLIPADHKTPEALGQIDTIPEFDQWILIHLLKSLDASALRLEQMELILDARRSTQWFSRYKDHYQVLRSACSFFDAHAAYVSQDLRALTAQEIFKSYCNSWYKVDESYRQFFNHLAKLPNGNFKDKLSSTKSRIAAAYDQFLVELTDAWQFALFESSESYPPQGMCYQANFFKDLVAPTLPAPEKGRKVGVIISDALRYEVGRELALALTHTRSAKLRDNKSITCRAALCALPSYTQLGMAALLPGTALEIDPASENVSKDGMPTNGMANRQKILDAAYPKSQALSANDLLEQGSSIIGEEAPLIYVYHNVIDKTGDSRDTEKKVFAACQEACTELQALAAELVSAGCGTIFISADHGFLYQDRDLDPRDYAQVEDLSALSNVAGVNLSRTRRFIVADILPKSETLIDFAAADLSLKGDTKIALPRGITRLRLQGSGSRFVHGGASLQETVIPVVTIKRDATLKKSYETDVQGFATGRLSITGSSVAIDVYQVQACKQTVLPTTVKIGLYAPEESEEPSKLLCATEKMLVLDSTSSSADARKTRVTLDITNDIDKFKNALVRISKQVGQTKQFKTVWEQQYSVDRAFGNDFDF